MKHLGTRELETERLILRPFKIADGSAMYKNWASDEEVTKYLTWPPHANVSVSEMVLEDWVSRYEEDTWYQWAIIYKPDSLEEPIGSIGVNHPIDEKIKSAELGYCIGRKWWYQGIVAEGVKRVMEYLFEEVGVNRIEATHDARNPNSGAVMRKCGMTYEGTRRSAGWNNQGICDSCCYSILAAERKSFCFDKDQKK